MATIDEVKEFIGFLKAVFLVLIAIDSSLIAWLFNHTELNTKSMIVIGVIVIITIMILIALKYILKEIKKLKDL